MMQAFAGSVWVTVFAVELVLYAVGTVFVIFMLVSERTVTAHKTAASMDPLTGMFNRRGFAEATSRVIEREANAGRPATVLIFDIDHFKSINDRFGHPAGDEILKLFATVVVNTLRITDLSGRIGGEEFAALLPCSLEDGVIAAERVREAFADFGNCGRGRAGRYHRQHRRRRRPGRHRTRGVAGGGRYRALSGQAQRPQPRRGGRGTTAVAGKMAAKVRGAGRPPASATRRGAPRLSDPLSGHVRALTTEAALTNPAICGDLLQSQRGNSDSVSSISDQIEQRQGISMKKLVLAVSILATSGFGASAADMAVKARPMVVDPSYNWTGFYIGANAGYGWEDRVGNLAGNSGGIAIPTALAGGTIPTFLSLRPEGGLGGVQAGYNWQFNHVVFGIEADVQAARIRQGVSIFNPGGGGLLPTINTAFSNLDWFGTVRGRVGYAWNTFMVYGTGGVAYGHTYDYVSSQTTTPPPFGSGSNSSMRTGWAAGAGFEWAFRPSWSLKGEYLHVDLGSGNTTASFLPSSPDFVTYNIRHSYDIVRGGLNYKFTYGPVVAKY